ncbi:odorant receptor 49b-like isoform X2 [Cylas formicarius]|uniref:odorant receptor 49b-like isoform X2 n=1 Tax=Cylas formicarius TaxID=197179 RepID=UPI002958336C|nr:odorant receptor 49b-like isoform X2 [Cylas formicarius]
MSSKKGYFAYIRFLMMVVGIWRIEHWGSRSNTGKVVYKAYSVTFQLICWSAMVSLAVELPELIRTDTVAAMDNVGRFIILGVIIFKMVMCQSERVLKLLRLALAQDAQILTETNAAVKMIYERHVSYDNKFVSLLVTSATCMGVCVSILGDVKCYEFLKRAENRNVSDKPVSSRYWYPFDRDDHYALVMVDQNLRPTLACLCMGVVSAFVNCVVVFLRLQLKLLQYDFRHVGKFDEKLKTASAERTVKMLCLKHQRLIEYVGEFNYSLKDIIFLEYMVTSVSFATLTVQIIAGQQVIFNLTVLMFTIVQLLTFAWNSNEIIAQSLELSFALYESRWYEQTSATKTLIHIMMMRCQKCLCLKIGVLGAMDLSAGISRLKLGYSYTSLMKTGE